MKAKIAILSYSFYKGGAAIAAEKFSQLLTNIDKIEVGKISQDNSGLIQFVKRVISFAFVKMQKSALPIKRSLNFFSDNKILKVLSKEEYDIYNLHWFNNDTLSIFDFDKIPKNSIITLHDEWLYLGTEHYAPIADTEYKYGFDIFDRRRFGLPLNYIAWKIKENKLKNRSDLIFTVPSTWIMKKAQDSAILHGKDIRLLPNPIDTNVFSPVDKILKINIRKKYGFDEKDFIFCFGAVDGGKNKLKGSEYINQAFKKYSSDNNVEKDGIKLIAFGGDASVGDIAGFYYRSVGHISNPEKLAEIYQLSDVVLVPSLLESFGQVAAEAQSCGRIVICFDTSGLRDIVIHNKTGLVAEPFCTASLLSKMKQSVALDSERRMAMESNARKQIVNCFSYSVVREKYLEILDFQLQRKQKDLA